MVLKTPLKHKQSFVYMMKLMMTMYTKKPGFISLSIFFIIAGALSLIFEKELRDYAQWIVENFGIRGMCFFVFIADAIVSPIPPDAMLFVIATSDLRENWIFYASLLGVSSVLGGNAGYWVGYLMREKSWLPQKFVILANKKKLMIEKGYRRNLPAMV